jgi:hypothetical protein
MNPMRPSDLRDIAILILGAVTTALFCASPAVALALWLAFDRVTYVYP